MKLITKITAGLVGIGLLAAASAQNASSDAPIKFELPSVGSTPAQPAAPAAPAVKYTEAQLMEAFGYITGLKMGLPQLEFNPAQVEAISRGMMLAARGQQPATDLKQLMPQLEELMHNKQEVYTAKVRNEKLAEAATFVAKLKENKNVQETPSGLRYEILKEGTGVAPKVGQVVKINYTGTFTDGQVFDSSVQPRRDGSAPEPAELLLQVPSQADPRGIIPGMVEGLQKMTVGGKAKLYIPAALAYGDNPDPRAGIPPGAMLIFEIELLDVKDAPPPPATK